MQVVGLKLITGEELVAQLEEVHEGDIKIKRALSLQMQMTKGGAQAGFVPWSLLIPDSESFVISAAHIITQFSVDSVVEKQYIQSVTGIDLTVSSSILHG